MPGLIGRALGGAGAALEKSGLMALESALMEQRQSRLAELNSKYRTAEQERGFAHDTKMQEGRQAFETSERRAGEEFRTSERVAGEKFTGEQNRQDRDIRSRQASSQEKQVNALVEKTNQELQLGKIKLEDARKIHDLHKKYLAATDPKEKESIADQIYTLSGKDKYTPLIGKDDMGNPVFMGAFNTRSGERKTGTSGSGVDWSQFLTPRNAAQPAPAQPQPRPVQAAQKSGPPGAPNTRFNLRRLMEGAPPPEEDADFFQN